MDAATAVQRLLGLELAPKAEEGSKPTVKPAIAFSYDEGSGGLEIARELADRLSIEVYDRRLLDAIANSSGITPAMLERLDDRYRSHWTDWLHAFKTDLATAQIQYYRHLTNFMLAIAANGGIIIGRGGNIILAHHRVFRIRIVGSAEYCAKRMVNTMGISYPEALARREKVDAEKARFIRQYFNRIYNDPSLFDLVLNTDRLRTHDQAVSIIEHAMEQMGYR